MVLAGPFGNPEAQERIVRLTDIQRILRRPDGELIAGPDVNRHKQWLGLSELLLTDPCRGRLIPARPEGAVWLG